MPLPSRSDILDVLSHSREPLRIHSVAAELRVKGQDVPGLVRLLDDMAMTGEVIGHSGHRYSARTHAVARTKMGGEREGILTVNQRGFGFVAVPAYPGEDVFVEEANMLGAMHSDRVKVAVRRRGPKGNEGEILEVLERGLRRVAGVLRRRRGQAWLELDDGRVRGPIPLPEDGGEDSGAGNSGRDGDAAIVRITRYPEFAREMPHGKLETILGRPGELRVETAKILVLAQVEENHSEQAFDEASSYGTTVPEQMLEGRTDLTHLPLPTIDPEDARDHDDAVWVERTRDGYRAWIAIADVSAYVRPGTKLDDEALVRGCSVYLPDRAIPMLPRPLSSNLCSLLPDEVRLCLCAEVELDEHAEIKKTQLLRGFMKSQAKLTYGGVARALGLSSAPPRDPKADHFVEGLRVAYELSKKLRKKRLHRGAVDFEVPEAKIVLDEVTREPIDVQRRGEDPGVKEAYRLIEELMLLANEEVARWLLARDVPGVFRVHAPPDEQKLERFATMCQMLGVPFEMEDALDPSKLSKLAKSFAGHEKASVLNMLLLRSMKQAAYDTGNIGHFGLASKAYVHFTSPIRRYPDLVVHRAVHSVLLGEKIGRDPKTRSALSEAALRSSQNERRAMEAERDVADLYRTWLMRDRVGERFEGMVTAIVGSGIYVALDTPFVDVLVKMEELGGDVYQPSDDGLHVVGTRSGERIQLGDRIVVEVTDALILRRQVQAKRFGVTTSPSRKDARAGAPRTGSPFTKPGTRRDKSGRKREQQEARKGRAPQERSPKKSASVLGSSAQRPRGAKKKSSKRSRPK